MNSFLRSGNIFKKFKSLFLCQTVTVVNCPTYLEKQQYISTLGLKYLNKLKYLLPDLLTVCTKELFRNLVET